jgi:class 3 adenylate cyclase/pimeloyl-ACP methyl ester carboxylesterase
MDPAIRYAKNGDVHLAYQVMGAGPIDILSTAAYPFAPPLDSWRDQPLLERAVYDLSSFARLILWDPRGMGLSDRFGHPYPIEEQVADASAVLDAVGSDLAVLTGWEQSGLFAMLFAAMRPERTSALVLFNAFATTLKDINYPWGQTLEERAADIASIVEHWGTGRELEHFAPSVRGNEAFRAWWAGVMARFLSPREIPAYFAVVGDIDARAVLPLINAPTLVLHRPDSWVQVENARYLAEHISGSVYRELPGIDSIAWLDGWEPLVDAIREFLTGETSTAAVEGVLTTVLFTDIVRSTEMVTRMGDRGWTELLDRYEAVTDRVLEQYSGRLVDRAGDGLFATFEGPARAIRCAAALRDRSRELGLETRSGVHIGEVSIRDGRVRGIAVHVGARIVGDAEPGEILVSRTVKDLVAGSGLDLQDRGEHQLKDVPEPQRLFAMIGAIRR